VASTHWRFEVVVALTAENCVEVHGAMPTQMRSLLGVGGACSNWREVHTVIGEQVMSEVRLHGMEMYCPAGHCCVQGEQTRSVSTVHGVDSNVALSAQTGQPWHTVSAVAVHGATWARLAGHVVHVLQARSDVGVGASSWYDMESHACQSRHCASEVSVAGTAMNWLLPHGVTVLQSPLVSVEYEAPSTHDTHDRSLVAVASDTMANPGLHVVALEQLSASLVVEKKPSPHGWHVRSSVTLPGKSIAEPASHVVSGLHASAPLSENVPNEHG